jgi:iron complex outermembrane receptor protein
MILPHFFKLTKPTQDMNKNGQPKQAVLFIMRVSLLQFILVLSCVTYSFAGTATGQEILDKKVSLNLPSKEIRTVLKAIAASTEIGFTYSNDVLQNRQKITVIANEERLGDLLQRIFGPLHISYEVIGHQIVLKKDPAAQSATTGHSAGIAFQPITGTVIGADGAPIPGVSVTIAGTTRGTTTDVQGHFSIDAKDGDVLVFSSIGFDIFRATVGATASDLHISLQKSNHSLNEVVVTALGIRREAKSLGYSAQQVSGSDVVKADAPDISNGLIGKVAGLNITEPNGVEGSSSRIVIRGNNSLLGNNQPLIVVDGVMIDNEPILPQGQSITQQNLLRQNVDLSQNQSIDYGSFLNTLNADDIETFNILKGPTAAALYGARGANGVILITTKKGRKLKGLGIDYNFADRWNQPYRFIKMQDEYGMGMADALYSANPGFYQTSGGQPRETNSGDFYGTRSTIPGVNPSYPGGNNWWNFIGFPGDGASWGQKMQGQQILWWDGTERPYVGNPNIFKSFYKTGNTMTHNVSFSGGGDVGTVRVSYTHTDNDAITYSSNFHQNVFNIGSSLNVSNRVKVEATVSYLNLVRENVPNVYGESAASSGVGYITDYMLPMDYKPLERGLAVNKDGSQNQTVISNSPSQDNPAPAYYWWNTLVNNTTFTQNQLLGSVKLIADITPWLNFTAHTGLDYYTNQFVTKNRPVDAAGLTGYSGENLYSNDLSTVGTQNLDALLMLHKDNLFPDFNASLTGGASYYHNKLYDISAVNPGPFNAPFTYSLANYAGTNPALLNPTENLQESEINSVYGLLNLSYKDYLFLEASGRNDWSSTLPPDKWSFFYPSANLSFVFTNALRMGSISNWLSYGKIRIAEAASANGYIPYQTEFIYNQVTQAGFTGGLTVPTTLPSVGIQPQRARSFEAGADLGFLNNRINLNFTYYDIYSDHQILPVNIATSSGADNLTINTGALQNRGVEMIINANVLRHKDFTWDIAVNGGHNGNKVIALEPGVTSFSIGQWFGGDGINTNVQVGDQYGTIYGLDYQYLGKQKVVNLIYGDGINTGNGPVLGAQYATTSSFVKIGNSTPKLTGGIGNTFQYKAFSLYVLADFHIGGQIWSGDYATLMGQGELPETTHERDGHGLPFTFPDGSTCNCGVILPGVTPDGKPNTAVVNSWWKYAGNYQSWDNIPIVRTNSIFTNSWGKLREVALSYKVPPKLTSATGIFQNLSVSLIGRDLFYLFTKLPDRLNPEGLTGTTNNQSTQFGSLPGTRSFGLSVKAGF